MTSYRRNFVPGGSYFFTVNLANRRSRLLTEEVNRLRSAFRDVRARHPFTVEAIVVLPDHLHAIWSLPDGDADFALRWRQIKSFFPCRWRKVSKSRPAVAVKAKEGFGSGAIGSTRCVTKAISPGTWTTSISTR